MQKRYVKWEVCSDMIHWTLSCYMRPWDLSYSFMAGNQCGWDRRSHDNGNMVDVLYVMYVYIYNTIAFILRTYFVSLWFWDFLRPTLYNELDYIGRAFWCCFFFHCTLDSVVVQRCMNGVAGNTKTLSLCSTCICASMQMFKNC